MKDVIQKYEPKEYWENRLSKDFNIRGAALSALSKSYNNWALRAGLRSLNRYICQHPFPLSDVEHKRGIRILDIGCGTGNTIEYWKCLGIEHITGIDITQISVTNLKNLYPKHDFYCLDIADESTPKILERKFDVISAMNILLHITDDEKFARSISNMSKMLKDGGFLIIADPIILHNYYGEPFTEISTSKCRHFREYLGILEKNHLKVNRILRTTFFMSNPIDAKNKAMFQALRIIWSAITILAKNEKTGEILGRTLYIIEGILPRIFKNGPTGKLLIAIKETVEDVNDDSFNAERRCSLQ